MLDHLAAEAAAAVVKAIEMCCWKAQDPDLGGKASTADLGKPSPRHCKSPWACKILTIRDNSPFRLQPVCLDTA